MFVLQFCVRNARLKSIFRTKLFFSNVLHTTVDINAVTDEVV